MPNMKAFHAQPANSMVCGAYSLTAIADAFGKQPATADIALDYASRKCAIKNGDGGLVLAASIYAITGCGPDGNNMPSAMCYVSQQLGLKPTAAFVKGCALLAHPKFGALFKGEQGACAKLKAGGAEALWASPSAGEAQAVCVDNGGGGFHWLALGEDGKYMDPADGKVHAWTDVTTKKNTYTPVGLWITFTT